MLEAPVQIDSQPYLCHNSTVAKKPGRKKMKLKCPLRCGGTFGARELRNHLPVCPKRKKTQ